jgi:type I restriction enzyme S subunit
MSLKFDAERLKKEILNKAFRGELTDQDISEGSGHELLHSIQLERKREEAGGKSKKGTELKPVETGEEPYLIPENWVWTRLGEIYSMSSGKSIGNKVVHGFPVYGSNGVLGYSSDSPLISGQRILVGRVGAVGAVHVASGEYWVSDNTFIVTFPIKDISFSWSSILLKYLKLGNYSVSTAQPVISFGKIRDILIPLPPQAEQHRIVEKIEKAFTLIDSLDFDTVLQDISSFRKEVLTRAFRGELTEQNIADGTGQELLASIQLEREQQRLGVKGKKKTELAPVESGEEPYEVPENWMWTRLGEVLEIKHGYAFKGSDFSESKTNRILVTPGNISTTGDYSTNKNRYYIEGGSIPEDYILVENDLIMNLTDLTKECKTLGRTVFIPNDKGKTYLHNQRLGKILIQSNLLLSKYIHYFSMGGLFRNHIVATATGTTVRHTSPDKIYKSSFPLPPLAEQQRIVEKIEAILTLDLGQAIYCW